jgi:hypothetical protein
MFFSNDKCNEDMKELNNISKWSFIRDNKTPNHSIILSTLGFFLF